MQTHDSDDRQSTGIDERDRRALEQYLTVLPEAPDLYEVVSESGSSYTVDVREGVCTCADWEYRQPDGGCKHARRVLMELGERPIPDDVDPDDLPADFGRHVEGGPNAGKPLAADGGQIIEPDYTHHVEPAEQGGKEYVRCEHCGAELLEALGGADKLVHASDCPHREGR